MSERTAQDVARGVSRLVRGEVGGVGGAGGGSSSMPQKMNPAGSVIALAAATRMPGLVAACLAGAAQEHERAAGGWQAEWPVVADSIATTGSALSAIASTLEGLAVYSERMRANLGATQGVIFAEKVRMMVQATIGREAAERLLAEATREALASARPFREVLRAQPKIASLLTAEQIDSVDRAEDYLGMAEEFRKKLLEE